MKRLIITYKLEPFISDPTNNWFHPPLTDTKEDSLDSIDAATVLHAQTRHLLRCSKPERENLRQALISWRDQYWPEHTVCLHHQIISQEWRDKLFQLFFRNVWKANRLLCFFSFFNRMVNEPSNVELIRWSDAAFFGAHHLPLNLTMNRLSTIPITVSASHTKFSADGSIIVTSAPLYANSTCTVSTRFLTYNKESSKATTKRNFGKFLMPIVIVDTLICYV